ncbi:hypothetical protein OAJ57_01965 [Alphaproteobacteria bacterium]|nr:hypothetical protein [Alphaproteobacteria bacterium]
MDAYNINDYATALREFRPLAIQEDAKAQNNLGHMFVKGQGVPQDYKTAVKWYTSAAVQGVADAQFNYMQLCYRFWCLGKPRADA